MPVYARAPAQSATAGNYVSQITDVMRSTSQPGTSAPAASQCATAPATGTNYAEVTATFANTCYISTATDMDFGSVVSLPGNRDQTSTISVRCPTGTNYRIALNYGANSTGGTTRRLLGPGGMVHVSSTTPRRVSNGGDDDLVILVVGGKGGYVGRDGHMVDDADIERRASFGSGAASA